MHRYITLSIQKYKTESAFIHLNLHDSRKNTTDRSNVDASKSHLNHTLIKNPYTSQAHFLKQKAHELRDANSKHGTKHRMIKEGASTFFSLVVQATNTALSYEEHQAFLNECFLCLKEHFKSQELLQATIHNDETTPHLHLKIAFFDNEKKKFNQKELLLSKHDRLETLFDVLRPIYQKFSLEKPPTLEERIDGLEDTVLQEQLRHLSKKEQRKMLHHLGCYGGEAYTPPSLLKLHETKIEVLLEKEIDLPAQEKTYETERKIYRFLDAILQKEPRKEGFFSRTLKGYYVDLEYFSKLKKALHFLKQTHQKKDEQINTMQKVFNFVKTIGIHNIHSLLQTQEAYAEKLSSLEKREQTIQQNEETLQSAPFYKKEYILWKSKYDDSIKEIEETHHLKQDITTLLDSITHAKALITQQAQTISHKEKEITLLEKTMHSLKEELKTLKQMYQKVLTPKETIKSSFDRSR
jgi:hypothetical protein